MKYTTTYLDTHYITAATATRVNTKTIPEDSDRVCCGAAAATACTETEKMTTTKMLSPPQQQQQQRHRRLEEGDGVDDDDVFLKCKGRPSTQLNQLENTNGAYFATDPLSDVFGQLNENEFSSNVWFKSPRLPVKALLEDGRNAIRRITRHVYEDMCTIFYDKQTMSTRYFENCSEFRTKIIVRLDCEDGDDDMEADCRVSASVKLRVFRSKMNWDDKTTVVLSRSMELPMTGWNLNDLKPSSGNKYVPLVKATKSRTMVFWGVRLTYGSDTYLFRVAFRHNPNPQKHIECNIECEDPIRGDLFGQMFYAIYKYYQFQYQTQDRQITPVIGDYELFRQSLHYTSDLTEDQQRTLDTLRLVAWPAEDPEVCAKSVAGPVAEFVTYLGIYAYVHFSEGHVLGDATSGNGVEYDKRFEHINVHESKDWVVLPPVDDEDAFSD